MRCVHNRWPHDVASIHVYFRFLIYPIDRREMLRDEVVNRLCLLHHFGRSLQENPIGVAQAIGFGEVNHGLRDFQKAGTVNDYFPKRTANID